MGPTIRDILTYNDSSMDTALNYAMLLASFMLLIILNDNTLSHIDLTSKPSALKRLRGALLIVLYELGLFAFQISLCLIVECVGISIVWCANIGIVITSIQELERRSKCQIWSFNDSTGLGSVSVLVSGLGLCFYYLIVEPPITTLAHACALLLGMLIGHLHLTLLKSSNKHTR